MRGPRRRGLKLRSKSASSTVVLVSFDGRQAGRSHMGLRRAAHCEVSFRPPQGWAQRAGRGSQGQEKTACPLVFSARGGAVSGGFLLPPAPALLLPGSVSGSSPPAGRSQDQMLPFASPASRSVGLSTVFLGPHLAGGERSPENLSSSVSPTPETEQASCFIVTSHRTGVSCLGGPESAV